MPKKTTASPEPKTTGELIQQPHGGALRNGGTNRGGPGRPSARLRAQLRKLSGTRIQVLATISHKRSTSKDSDKIRAIDIMLKYGLDNSMSVADFREFLHAMSELAYEMLPEEMADTFLTQCGELAKRAVA